jgi:type IV secretory pathway VirB4 component
MPGLTTQQFLEIEDIKEGVLILKDKSLRGILAVSSINFELKSSKEQEATIFQFQNFLNSLDFFVQIYIHSRRLNLAGYLEKLKELEKKQTNTLLKIQTSSYIEFIKGLITQHLIMSKNCYLVVPFHPGISLKGKTSSLSDEEFQRAKVQLWERMEFVAHGLRNCGLFCFPLNTQELIELFWAIYHPEESEFGFYPEIPPELIK